MLVFHTLSRHQCLKIHTQVLSYEPAFWAKVFVTRNYEHYLLSVERTIYTSINQKRYTILL